MAGRGVKRIRHGFTDKIRIVESLEDLTKCVSKRRKGKEAEKLKPPRIFGNNINEHTKKLEIIVGLFGTLQTLALISSYRFLRKGRK